jgi:hypothetical protein
MIDPNGSIGHEHVAEGGILELDSLLACDVCDYGICNSTPHVLGSFTIAGRSDQARIKSVTSSIRDINELVAYVRVRAVEWIGQCNAAGLDPRISETYRTDARQAWLFTQGLTTVRLTGAHGFRVALDYFFVEGGKTAYPPAKMKAAADIAKKLGFAWGGDWVSFRDTPHLEMLGGVMLAQYRQGRRPAWYDWQPYEDESEELTVKRYNSVNEIKNELGEWASEIIEILLEKELLKGDYAGNLDLSADMIRLLVINHRAGMFT